MTTPHTNSAGGVAALTALVALALVLQVAFFPHLAWHGVVPNLCLLLVVGAALARGPQFGMLVGFGAGVLLDLAPPAEHVIGRWALALVVVGYVAGRVRTESAVLSSSGPRPPVVAVLATVAVCSLLGTSVFTLVGLLIGDLTAGFGEILAVIGASLVFDLLLTPFVLPVVLRLCAVTEPLSARA